MEKRRPQMVAKLQIVIGFCMIIVKPVLQVFIVANEIPSITYITFHYITLHYDC